MTQTRKPPFLYRFFLSTMKDIEFDAQFGNAVKRVKCAFDKSVSGYQILIGNFYQGVISYRNGEWTAHLNSRSILIGDDVFILGEIIEKEN